MHSLSDDFLNPTREPGTRTAKSEYLLPEIEERVFRRPRVNDELEASITGNRITVVAAPSGFGKTVAVSAYLDLAKAEVLWVTIPESGQGQTGLIDDLRCTITDLSNSLNAPRQLSAVKDLDGINTNRVSTKRKLNDVPIIVVDDFHLASSTLRDDLLNLLTSSSIPSVKLVIIGHSQILGSLSKVIARHPEALITGNELAFDTSELSILCRSEFTSLDPHKLMQDTGGLPIAVNLFLKLKRGNIHSDSKIQDILSGYVREHVLGALPREQSMMLQVLSVSDQFSSQFAVEVVGRQEAELWLEKFVSLGFMTRHYSVGGELYAVQPVVRKQCLKVLSGAQPELLKNVHKQAARFLEVGSPLVAMNHYRSAGKIDEAVEILKKRWVRLLLEDRYPEVTRWCSSLEERLSDDPSVLLISACAEELMGHRNVARARFERAQAQICSGQGDRTSQAILKLARLFLVDEQDEALAASDAVRQLMGSNDPVVAHDYAALQMLVGWAELRIGKHLDLSQELLFAATSEAEARGEILLEQRGKHHQTAALVLAGKHQQAKKLVDECRSQPGARSCPESSIWAGGAQISQGIMSFWEADFFQANLELSDLFASDIPASPFGAIARFYAAVNAAFSMDPVMRRRAAAGLQAIPRASLYGQDWSVYRDTALALLEEAAGNRSKALAIVGRYSGMRGVPLIGVSLASILRRNGDLTGALQMLAMHQQNPDCSYLRVSTLLTAALVYKNKGDAEAAHEYCESALEIGSLERIKLPFCDGDLAVRILLAEHLLRPTKYESFVTECLTYSQGSGLLDCLSSRETDVFRLLQTTRTVKEIADQLDVSVNTVKTHQRSIYRKLGVQNRREAQKVVA